MRDRPVLNIALVDVGQEHREVLRQACIAAGYSPAFRALRDPSPDGLGRWADLVVVESDLGYRALRSAERVRGAGTPPVGVLVNWWSDLEWDARQAADFVLHVPLTPDEVSDVLASAVLSWTGDALASAAARPAAAEQVRAAPVLPVSVLASR